jgi:hypothetical protein
MIQGQQVVYWVEYPDPESLPFSLADRGPSIRGKTGRQNTLIINKKWAQGTAPEGCRGTNNNINNFLRCLVKYEGSSRR